MTSERRRHGSGRPSTSPVVSSSCSVLRSMPPKNVLSRWSVPGSGRARCCLDSIGPQIGRHLGEETRCRHRRTRSTSTIPSGYVEAAPHEQLARLRREQPVFRQEMPDGSHYWALLKHADIVDVSKRPELFSAELGGVVLEDQPPEQLEQTKNMLLMMDPPRHSELRKKVYPHFRPRQIAELEPRSARSVASCARWAPRRASSSSCTTSPR